MTVPRYREHPEQLPPTLVMEGARVNPEWLAKFLKDPALAIATLTAIVWTVSAGASNF